MFILAGVPTHEKGRMGVPFEAKPDRVVRNCGGCGMEILVGPRILAVTASTAKPALCPRWANARGGGSDAVSLGGL